MRVNHTTEVVLEQCTAYVRGRDDAYQSKLQSTWLVDAATANRRAILRVIKSTGPPKDGDVLTLVDSAYRPARTRLQSFNRVVYRYYMAAQPTLSFEQEEVINDRTAAGACFSASQCVQMYPPRGGGNLDDFLVNAYFVVVLVGYIGPFPSPPPPLPPPPSPKPPPPPSPPPKPPLKVPPPPGPPPPSPSPPPSPIRMRPPFPSMPSPMPPFPSWPPPAPWGPPSQAVAPAKEGTRRLFSPPMNLTYRRAYMDLEVQYGNVFNARVCGKDSGTYCHCRGNKTTAAVIAAFTEAVPTVPDETWTIDCRACDKGGSVSTPVVRRKTAPWVRFRIQMVDHCWMRLSFSNDSTPFIAPPPPPPPVNYTKVLANLGIAVAICVPVIACGYMYVSRHRRRTAAGRAVSQADVAGVDQERGVVRRKYSAAATIVRIGGKVL